MRALETEKAKPLECLTDCLQCEEQVNCEFFRLDGPNRCPWREATSPEIPDN